MMKYPRTHHLPWSLGKTSDDKTMKSTHAFHGKMVVVTEKLDGENTTLYRDVLHARSLDSRDHASRHWLKAYHASLSFLIPKHLKVCGENVYASHSILYESLENYFYMFSVWENERTCLSWDDTVYYSERFGIPLAPVLYIGLWDEKKIMSLYTGKSLLGDVSEGYVVRIADSFDISEFNRNVGKFVRDEHVQTDEHWMDKKIVPNQLKKS